MIVVDKLPIHLHDVTEIDKPLQPGLHYFAKGLTEDEECESYMPGRVYDLSVARHAIQRILEKTLPYLIEPANCHEAVIGRSETKRERQLFDYTWECSKDLRSQALQSGINHFVKTKNGDWYLGSQVFVDAQGNSYPMMAQDGLTKEFETFAKSCGAYDSRPDKFMSLFDHLTEEKRGQERALYLLFTYSRKLLVHLHECDYSGAHFHRDLRQTDVTDSGKLDMVAWQLLHSSDLFWTVLGDMQKDGELI